MCQLLLAVMCWASLGSAGAADALRYRALLVGVSEYPLLQGKNLRGPKEDVARMGEELARRGVPPASIVVLTETDDQSRLPTRQRILDELGNLAKTARKGDYIVIMMAGHGSQVPVPAGSPFQAQEPDGRFEVFLPRDVSNWDDGAAGGSGDIVNAIKDHEIRALVDQMVARGAFVWAIFDACHSATLVRGGDVVLRQLEPSDLKIPASRFAEAERRAKAMKAAPPPAPAARDTGRAVYFYAAQTTEAAPEMQLPREVAGSPVHGLFSFSLIKALERGVPMTYRQLSEYVLMQYASTPEARAVSPAFSGGRGLDTPVLGSIAPAVRQWPLARDAATYKPKLEIKAGLLAQVRPGAQFALFKSALDGEQSALGQAVVVEASASEARLVMLDKDGRTSVKADVPEGATVARLVRAALDFGLTVAVDLQRCSQPCQYQTVVSELRASGAPGVAVRWADAGQPSDLTLRAEAARLWVHPAGYDPGQDCRQASKEEGLRCLALKERSFIHIDAAADAAPADVKEALGAALHRAARAINLMRIAREQTTVGATQRLAVSVAPLPERASGGQRAAGPGGRAGAAMSVKTGSRIRVTLTNGPGSDQRQRSLDVTALWIDSKFGVKVLWPESGEYNRLDPGASKTVDIDIDAEEGSTLGPEQVAVIAVEVEKHSAVQSFDFLEQPALQFQKGGVTMRGAGGDALDLFADAGFAQFLTRGARVTPVPASVGMRVIPLRVLP